MSRRESFWESLPVKLPLVHKMAASDKCIEEQLRRIVVLEADNANLTISLNVSRRAHKGTQTVRDEHIEHIRAQLQKAKDLIHHAADENERLKKEIAELEEIETDLNNTIGFLENGIKDNVDTIAALESRLADRVWRLVEDGLPDEGQNVLIFGPERNKGIPFSKVWDWMSKNYHNTHWMPIPTASKKKEGEK